MSKDTDTSAAAVLADLMAGSAPLSPNQARKLKVMLRDGRAHDLSWIFRMIHHGAKGVNGQRIKLEHAHGPSGTIITTEPAVMRWLAKLNGTDAASLCAHQQTDRHHRAQRALAAAGL